jgi:hypothetical protein
LRHALIAGVRRVIARRDALNKINVFPVPDGDTGNNLALTLGTVLTGALHRRAGGVGRLLRRVGDEARGMRGPQVQDRIADRDPAARPAAIHAEHAERIGRLERHFRWMFAALVVAVAVGFAAGWKWRGEVAAPPQIIYAPALVAPKAPVVEAPKAQ